MEHFFTKRGEGIEVERLGAGDQSTMSEDEEKEVRFGGLLARGDIHLFCFFLVDLP